MCIKLCRHVIFLLAALLRDIEQIPCSAPADLMLYLAHVADESMGGSSGAVTYIETKHANQPM